MKNQIKLIISIFSFSFLSCLAFGKSENSIKGIIVSNQHEPLDFVNIGIIGTSLGTVSDEHGQFQLYFNETVKNTDTIRFSSIGFESQNFSVQDLKGENNLTIILSTKTTQLEEVVVIPEFENSKLKGNKNTDARMNVYYSISKKPNQNLGAEIGRKFKIKKKSRLRKMRFYIAQNNFDTVLFRINVYHLKKRKPGKNILSQNIIHEVVGKKSGWIEVDLMPYQILTNRSVVVGVEWIGHSKNGKYLTLPITVPSVGSVHFYKYGSQNKWKRFDLMSSCMELEYGY